MPKTNIPSYRPHRPTGQAIVSLRGKMFYLGQYKSQASREKYNALIADYLANDCKLPPARGGTSEITIEEAAIRFLEYAEGYYLKNGKQTSTFINYREALLPVVRWCGQHPISDFGPLALQFVRDKLIETGYVRKTINDRISCVVCCFQWLANNEYCHVDIYNALKAVPRLEAGRTKAPDNPPVPPVPVAVIEATLPFLPPVVADMVQVQRYAGMRPQDVRNMRSCDIDRTGDVWVYRPLTHQTEHHGKRLIKAIGPRAQAILLPYLDRKAADPEAYLFSPADSEADRIAKLRDSRKTKVQPSQQNRWRSNPKRTPKEQYTNDSYNRAVDRAIIKYNKAEGKAAKVAREIG